MGFVEWFRRTITSYPVLLPVSTRGGVRTVVFLYRGIARLLSVFSHFLAPEDYLWMELVLYHCKYVTRSFLLPIVFLHFR